MCIVCTNYEFYFAIPLLSQIENIMLGLNEDYMIVLGQTNLISGSTDFFQNLKGRSVGKKRKIKKNPQFFALVLIINKSFL